MFSAHGRFLALPAQTRKGPDLGPVIWTDAYASTGMGEEGFFSFGAMVPREAHSGSAVRNQGPVESGSSVGDIKGIGKEERGWRRRERTRKREVRKAFKVVAGADLRERGGVSSVRKDPKRRIINHRCDAHSIAVWMGWEGRGGILG